MGKKRKKKFTVYGVVEGDTEAEFLVFLEELYQPEKNNINLTLKNSEGGKPDSILKFALTECQRDRSFAWFDEDFEPSYTLGQSIREKLADCWKVNQSNVADFLKCHLGNLQATYNPNNKKPVLIVSQPVCSESLIIKTLGHEIPDTCKVYNSDPTQRDKQIKALKDKLNKITGDGDKIDYYRKKLNKLTLEEKRELIPELNLLISMITK